MADPPFNRLVPLMTTTDPSPPATGVTDVTVILTGSKANKGASD